MEDLAYLYYVLNEEATRPRVESDRVPDHIPTEYSQTRVLEGRTTEAEAEYDRCIQYYPTYPTLYL